uniref:Uncharacterized protein n=1 Tax=Anas zonorhyncha TaxID=75864 RepID=A0A8B9ZPM0_9AVES
MASIPAGLFAVYKPPGVSWCRVRDAVRARLLRELNEAPEPPPRQRIRFLPAAPGAGGEPGLVPAWVPVLAEHPLVRGPRFRQLKVGAGHRLDVKASGVFGGSLPAARAWGEQAVRAGVLRGCMAVPGHPGGNKSA